MAIVVPDEGLQLLLSNILVDELTSSNVFVLRLYRNDYTPDADTTADDFDEADFTGYVPVSMARADWSMWGMVDGRALARYRSVPYSWYCEGGSNLIYGYYYQDYLTGTVVAAERFPTPIDVLEGGIITLWPTFTTKSEF